MLKNLINFIAKRNDPNMVVYFTDEEFSIKVTRQNKSIIYCNVIIGKECHLSIQTEEQALNDSGCSSNFEGDAEEITSIILCNRDFKQLASDFCKSEDYPVVEAYSKLLETETELVKLQEQVAEIETDARCYADECDYDERQSWLPCSNSEF